MASKAKIDKKTDISLSETEEKPATDVVVNGKAADLDRLAFINRTHTHSVMTVTLEIFAPRHNSADFAVATNLQQLGARLTELLKNEAIKLVSSANESAMQYEEFTPGLAVSRSTHNVAQKDLPKREYDIYLGMVTDPAQDSVAN